jgi:hypothetical protein
VTLSLAAPLTIRASSGQRPIVHLAAPLRFRPALPDAPSVPDLVVRLEGLFLARAAAMPPTEPLIARAAVARLEIDGCTLDPGGHRLRDGGRAPLSPALDLRDGYGFADPADLDAFQPTPDVVMLRSVAGALRLDGRYALTLADSIVDAGASPAEPAGTRFAIAAATNSANGWAAPLDLRGAHLMGRVRVAGLNGGGGLFLQRLEVLDNQHGCLKFSWISGDADRLPHHYACLTAAEARLVLTSTWHGDPAYGQLGAGTDPRVLNRGPGDDAMGAFGFTLDAHKWANLAIRLREFMPVGVRPLTIPVT